MKLYKLTILNNKDFYVVAPDPTSAEKNLVSFLEKEEWFFSKDRAVKTIEVLADTDKYTDGKLLIC